MVQLQRLAALQFARASSSLGCKRYAGRACLGAHSMPACLLSAPQAVTGHLALLTRGVVEGVHVRLCPNAVDGGPVGDQLAHLSHVVGPCSRWRWKGRVGVEEEGAQTMQAQQAQGGVQLV